MILVYLISIFLYIGIFHKVLYCFCAELFCVFVVDIRRFCGILRVSEKVFMIHICVCVDKTVRRAHGGASVARLPAVRLRMLRVTQSAARRRARYYLDRVGRDPPSAYLDKGTGLKQEHKK